MNKVLAVLLGVMLLVGSSLSTGHGQSGGDGSKASERKKHDFANSIGMKFVSIAPGEFTMGSPDSEKGRFPNEVQHKVKLTRGFTMGVTPVTQGQWRSVMGTTVAQQRDKGDPKAILVGEGDALPMYYVSWDDAVEFCKRLGQTERRKYRLPTEAEWEYACRAGTQSAYGGSGSLDEMGWYGDNSGDQRIDSVDMWNKDPANYFQRLVTQYNCRPHPVGGKRPNAWGLYDMHGNVWQWCSDYYGNYPAGPTTDPTGPQQGTSRVLRGGAWDIRPAFGRAAFRHKHAPDSRNVFIGFRLCLDS